MESTRKRTTSETYLARSAKKTSIDKPYKSLKKTSASLLRESEQFNHAVELFLGHAPQNISERHYAADPQQLLDNAIGWLYEHYAKHNCFTMQSFE